jgi:CRISPR/Cas system endoribonuclease Cas6 (RAMP superfamily)
LRTAILVSNTRVAYLARIAFGHAGEANYRVFYNDFAAAFRWLEERAA